MNTETTCVEKQPLTDAYLEKMNAYWRAANYLSAAQLYLLDNPLLREPLKPEESCALVYMNVEGDVSEAVLDRLRGAIDLRNLWKITL